MSAKHNLKVKKEVLDKLTFRVGDAIHYAGGQVVGVVNTISYDRFHPKETKWIRFEFEDTFIWNWQIETEKLK